MEEKEAEAEKKSEEPKKEGGEKEEKKKKKPEGGEEANKDAPPPPPPQEIVLKVFMHCEGCAKKVRRSLKGFPGVEDVITDSKTHKVVVKGEKADPVKVVERIQRKSHRKVELISPIPKQEEEPEKPKAAAAADQEAEKPQDKKKEEPPQVITLVLKIHMHCDACSLAIKKRILRIKGVESVDTDLKSSQVTVVGVLDPTKLVDYLYKRTGKHAVIVKQDPPPPNKEDNHEEKKKKEEEINKVAGADDQKEPKTEGGAAADDKDEKMKDNGSKGEEEDEKTKLIELKQNELYYCPAFYAPKFAMDQYYYSAAAAHPPQMFSDENPNACSVM